jgi:hypothetical protein
MQTVAAAIGERIAGGIKPSLRAAKTLVPVDTSGSPVELREPLLEEAPLGVRVNELERARVGRAGVFDAIEPAQQVRADRVQVMVLLELEALDQSERGLDLARFGDRGSLVELDDGRAGEAGELAVQSGDLRPVLGLVQVQGCDRRLQHIGIAAVERQRALERGPSLLDLVEVPERSILVAEEPRPVPSAIVRCAGRRS